MKIESRTYEANGVEFREEVPPEGYVVIETYRPHSCPWDYYGNKFLMGFSSLLNDNHISNCGLTVKEKRLNPMGSGRGGQVRFGDESLPGVYKIAVPESEISKAKAVYADYRQQVEKWLYKNGPMPKYSI